MVATGFKPQEQLRRIAGELQEIANGESDSLNVQMIDRAIRATNGVADRIDAREDRLMREAFGPRRENR